MHTTSVEKELMGLERQFWKAMQEKDVETCLRLTDFPAILTGAQGTMQVDEAQFRQMMASPAYEILDVQLSDDAQVRLIRDDVAVVAYRVHEELQVEGKPLSIDANDSSTWIKRDGAWKCALHSESIAGDPFGRDRGKPGPTA